MNFHGQHTDWHETDVGHHMIYMTDPANIPASCAERVIYELRLDIDRLNSEVMETKGN